MTKFLIVLPAFNAEQTLSDTYFSLPRDDPDYSVLLVDDASEDQTVKIARNLNIKVIRHAENLGYGGNQKTCYQHALETNAQIVLMLHPDGQYDPRVIPIMIKLIELGICDIVLGNRIRTRSEALSGGMPAWKYVANRSLTLLENFVLGQTLGEFHSGLRCYSRRVLEVIPFECNSNDFVFDQEFLVQAAHFGFKIGDIPVPVKYFPEASSINFRRSVRYGLGTIGVLFCYLLHRISVRFDSRFTPSGDT